MQVHKYSDHSISRCEYIYYLSNANVVEDYLNKSNGYTNVKNDVSRLDPGRRFTIDESNRVYIDNLKECIDIKFTLKTSWNVLVITDSENDPLSIIYDTYILNTKEVDEIHLVYTINYSSDIITTTIELGSEYVKHSKEYIGAKMQPIPNLMSRVYERSVINWSDQNYEMNYTSGVLKDNVTSYDYRSKFNINPNLVYTSGHEYYLTGTNQGMFVIDVNRSANTGKLYSLNNQGSSDLNQGINLTIPSATISYISLVENGYGIIMVSDSGDIYWSKATNRRPSWEFSNDWGKLELSNISGYDILIPTFIDLCGSYVKLPSPKSQAVTAYEVKKWTGLFTESNTYGDRIYTASYNNPSSIPPGDSKLDISYWESLGIPNNASYFMTSNSNQNSPVSLHQFDTTSPTEGNSTILDLNLRMMTTLYVDLMNSGRLDKRIIPRDCGLEIVNPSDENEFITYLGDHYRLPEGAKIMNMCYYINNPQLETSTIVSLINRESQQQLSSNILSAKYGIVLTQDMITPSQG